MNASAQHEGSTRVARVVFGVPPNTSFNQLFFAAKQVSGTGVFGATPKTAGGTPALPNHCGGAQ